MSTIKIPHNGLPKEVTSILYSQLFILTCPYLGVTAKNVHMMQFVLSMAKDFKQGHNIHTMPVDYSGLWDCIVCKVYTDKGDQILISNKDSIIEMLCEFWGLNYSSVCGSYTLPDRYKSIPLGGKIHPIRVTLPSFREPVSGLEKEDTISLHFLGASSREKVWGNIRSSIIDNLNHNYGITLDDIIAIYKEEEKNRKTYTLDIEIEPKTVYEKGKPVERIKKCGFKLTDNFGGEYYYAPPVKSMAIYLTFMLFPEGLTIKQVAGNKKFYDAFKEIYLQLPRHSLKNLPKNFDGLSETDSNPYTLFLQELGAIRDAILDLTNDNSAREKFAVEGNGTIPFRVAGATDEHREKIKRKFGLK